MSMSGGVSHPLFRLPIPASRTVCIVLAGAALSACGLLRTPAPISEAEVETVDNSAASAPAASSEAAAAPQAASAPQTAPPSSASSEPQKKPHREPPKPRTVKPPPPPPPPPAPPPLFMTRMLPRDEVHTLLDSGVQKRNGKMVGRAIDMVVSAHGIPHDLIINLQGFMGIGDRKVTFPWQLFRFTPGDKNTPILLDAPAAPAASDNLPIRLPGATATRLPLIDATVEHANGAALGRVVDVLIDRTGQPQALVIDLNGLVDMRHAIAVDWSAVRFERRGATLHAVLDLNETQLKAAPAYTNDKPIVTISPPPEGARR
jgi:hypothetical protein